MQTLGNLIRQKAQAHAARAALVFADRTTSYEELNLRSNRVANALADAGIGHGDRVAYLGLNTDAFFEFLFGAAKLGAVLVPVNWRLAPPEVAFILSDSGARLVLCDDERHALALAAIGELDREAELICLGEQFETWRDQAAASDPMIDVAVEDIAVQMYTSGTTGTPKGAMMAHRNFAAQRENDALLGEWAIWAGDDVNLVALPLFHIGGLGWSLVGLQYGTTNIIHPSPAPDAILRDIERHRISQMLLVPAVLQEMVTLAEQGGYDLSSVRVISYGAAPMSPALLDRMIAVFGCRFAQLYGMTEATGTVSCLPPEDHDPKLGDRMKSCGRALPLVEFSIRDAEGAELPSGEIGELYVRSPAIMVGYCNLPDQTEKAFEGEWYKTGDAGYLDADGYFFICDRIKDMIISGGENVYPAEVENAIYSMGGITECAVIGVPDEKWGETVKAFLVAEPGKQFDTDDLTARLRQRLAGYKLPRLFEFVDALPRNASGKILKTQLRDAEWGDTTRRVN